MKVKFMPQNIEHDITPNQTILDLANEHEIYIKSVCRGVPSCAECRIRVIEGDYNLFPPSQKELALIGTAYFVDQRRLSCQLRCFGDVTIDLTEQIEKEQSGQADDSSKRKGNIIHEKDENASAQVEARREDQKMRKAEELMLKQRQREELDRIKARKSGTPEDQDD